MSHPSAACHGSRTRSHRRAEHLQRLRHARRHLPHRRGILPPPTGREAIARLQHVDEDRLNARHLIGDEERVAAQMLRDDAQRRPARPETIRRHHRVRPDDRHIDRHRRDVLGERLEFGDARHHVLGRLIHDPSRLAALVDQVMG